VPERDAARALVVERDLVRSAFEHLTVDAFMALPFEAVGPTKALLKRFFSTDAWTADDDAALAAAVGPGEGRWRRHLDADVALEYGWDDGRFAVRVESVGPTTLDAGSPTGSPPDGPDPLAETFDGPVVPEATPNPRTIRFHVGAIHSGPSRWYEAAAAADGDPGSRRLFAEFAEVANVLVGPDFVAVGLRRAAAWERLLAPVLAVVTEEFATPGSDVDRAPRVMGGPAGAGAVPAATAPDSTGHRVSRLEQAWRDLGSLRPADADDLTEVLAAACDDDSSRRQVAASLLGEADAEVAAAEWTRLASDPVRAVRRASADAMVDADRQALRPVLEAALSDADAWVRWKVLRGLALLGAGPSRDAIGACVADPDFRVRLEAAAALRSVGNS